MTQTVTAFFDRREDADAAVTQLVGAGVPRDSITVLPGSGSGSTYNRSSGATSYDHRQDEGGFWSSLSDFFMPDEDRHSASEALSRGNIMVSVRTEDDDLADRAADILETTGSVDINEREASWRSEGWTGYTGRSDYTGGSGFTSPSGTDYGSTGSGAIGGSAATGSTTTGSSYETGGSTMGGSSAGSGMTGSGYARTGTETDSDVIPVVEEELRVGKRQVREGRVRVRSYVVETPVEEDVRLRRERAHVERRPVDRPVGAGDEALFRERTVEVEEMGEEAVVSKEARVKEELVVRKDVEEEVQRVSDTVRRTEVDVEDDTTRTGTTGYDRTDDLTRRTR